MNGGNLICKVKKWRILALSTIATSFFALQTAEAATYTVQKGDTLSKIAQNHQVSIQDLKNGTIYRKIRFMLHKN